LVTITTGKFGLTSLMSSNVASPSLPGICSSKSTKSKGRFSTKSKASSPVATGVILQPFPSKKRMCGFKSSISSSTHKISFKSSFIL
jgi:hypothetical protein